MADALTAPERNEVSARMSNAAQAFAMINNPLSSDFGVTSTVLADSSLIYTVGSTGTAGDNEQCDDSSFRVFLSRGPPFSEDDLEAAITDTHNNLSTTGEGQAGGLKIRVEKPGDGSSVNVTYSLISHAPETKELSEEQQAEIKKYEDPTDDDLDAEIRAQEERMGAGSHATGSQGGSTQ